MHELKRYVWSAVILGMLMLLKFEFIGQSFAHTAKVQGANLSREEWDPVIAEEVNQMYLAVHIDGRKFSNLEDGIYMDDERRMMLPTDLLRDGFACSAHLYDEKLFVIEKSEDTLEFEPNQNYYIKNKEKIVKQPSLIEQNGRYYLPLDILMEEFGYASQWDMEENVLIVQSVRSDDDIHLPYQYDLRAKGRAPKIRDQGPYGTCWAFASLTALESALMPETNMQLSVDHMNQNHSFTSSLKDGGQYTMAMAYLAAWQGPVREEDDPYGDGDTDPSLTAVKHVQDMQIIDELANAMTEMYAMYVNSKLGELSGQLKNTIISNHRMEGFSLIPGTFVAEIVGENASEHYGMKPGDVCYKKMRGRDEPCINCPALQLDNSDKLFASSAYYDETDRRWLDVTASVEENSEGERRYIISSTDITDCLGNIRMADSLTGVMTFDVFTAEALKMTSGDNFGGTVGSFVAVINVADFRRINEEKSFELGNSILVSIAEIIQRCVGIGELLGRSEGSRFAALFRNTDKDEFTSRMNLMLNSIQRQIYEKLHTQIYLLAGVCDMNDDPVGFMGALDRAITAQKTIRDRAYYHENLVAFYDGALREKIKERRHIEANMISALENDEFHVFYQPKVNIATGRVVGAEALVRWIRPDNEIISPGKFVPIFEENGFITEMDFAIYRTAITDIKRWLREGIDVPLVSLNVSRHHLADDNFCEKLNALVDNIGVPHELIELEITESLLTENLNKLVETVTWFKDRGFRISIDDFGSGYSSLNLITMLPFDTLKIDGGFFLRNDLTEKNKKVITSVVTLAKSLNLETVSEGVETQVQVDFLRDLGCDMIQGFFYYKPMTGGDFHQLLQSQTEKTKA